MVRQTTTVVAVVAALWSAACSVHISTGPSSAAHRSGPQPNAVVWTSAPRPHRDHPDYTPREPRDRDDAPAQQRPNRQFDAADELAAEAASHRKPRKLAPPRRADGAKDGEGTTVATPSHTGRPQKPRPGDVGQWVNTPGNGHRPDAGPQLGGSGGDSGGKSPVATRSSLPQGDGRLQRVAKQDR